MGVVLVAVMVVYMVSFGGVITEEKRSGAAKQKQVLSTSDEIDGSIDVEPQLERLETKEAMEVNNQNIHAKQPKIIAQRELANMALVLTS